MIRFLRALGFDFHIDYDGELLIEKPDQVSVEGVLDALSVWREEWEKEFRFTLLRAAARERRCFMGGPRDGKLHNQSLYRGSAYFRGFHEARAKWAVYEFFPDGRAIFRGFAASEQKARRGRLRPKEKEPPTGANQR